MGAEFCFNIYDGKRALMVAAASSTEKSQWIEDIGETVQVIRQHYPTDNSYFPILNSSIETVYRLFGHCASHYCNVVCEESLLWGNLTV